MSNNNIHKGSGTKWFNLSCSTFGWRLCLAALFGQLAVKPQGEMKRHLRSHFILLPTLISEVYSSQSKPTGLPKR